MLPGAKEYDQALVKYVSLVQLIVGLFLNIIHIFI